jgi:hypothetical protein
MVGPIAITITRATAACVSMAPSRVATHARCREYAAFMRTLFIVVIIFVVIIVAMQASLTLIPIAITAALPAVVIAMVLTGMLMPLLFVVWPTDAVMIIIIIVVFVSVVTIRLIGTRAAAIAVACPMCDIVDAPGQTTIGLVLNIVVKYRVEYMREFVPLLVFIPFANIAPITQRGWWTLAETCLDHGKPPASRSHEAKRP